MEFPSSEIKEFCDNLQTLVAVRAGKLHPDGICECEIDSFIAHYLKDETQKTHLANGLFWTVWVRNAIELVTENEKELYERFRSVYHFPKVFAHKGKYASPFAILSPCRLYTPPDERLLMEGRDDIWGNVGCWLNSIRRQDVAESVIKLLDKERKESEFPVDIVFG